MERLILIRNLTNSTDAGLSPRTGRVTLLPTELTELLTVGRAEVLATSNFPS